MKTRNLLAIISVLTCGMFSVSAAHAIPIFVNNFSFETIPGGGFPFGCGTNCSYSIAPIPGWLVTGAGATGQFRPGPPTNTTYFDFVPDGITVAYTNDGTISQIVGSTVQLGFTYTLMVDQGVRHDYAVDPGLIELVIGLNPPIFATGVPAAPFSGRWSTYTATYVGTAGDVGKTIGISLLSSGPQGDWDNVRLNAVGPNAVPEPASLALLGLGLAAFAVTRRRIKA